jgi:hypothetical protein
MDAFHVDNQDSSIEHGASTLKTEESDTVWYWLNFQTLLGSSSFTARRLDIQAK